MSIKNALERVETEAITYQEYSERRKNGYVQVLLLLKVK